MGAQHTFLRRKVDPKATLEALIAVRALCTQVTIPFKPGDKVQVKVIDSRGNAVVNTMGA